MQIASEGPDIGAFGPYVFLPLPGGGPYALTAKASTQRNGIKMHVREIVSNFERLGLVAVLSGAGAKGKTIR